MRVHLLGPVVVEDGSREVVLDRAKERSLVAALALSPGSVVGTDRLIDSLWGDAPPDTARKTLQTYVSHLRRALGAGVVVTGQAGYALHVRADDVDVVRFRTLVRQGEDALRAGEVERARRLLDDAVRLWRGEPFGGVGPHTGLAGETVRLREEHASALESRIAAELAAGRHREIVAELEMLVREHPFRERLWGQLMTALIGSDRQAEALAAYERARVLLRDELGLEPGGELRRIHRAVLDDEPSRIVSSVAQTTDPRDGQPFRSAIRYAVGADGVHIAYQTVGDGPIDVIAVPGFVSHLDMWWNAPTDHLVRRLASFSRLILFDKRGMGLSDRPARIDPDDWVDDVGTVLDAVGSERAALFGISAGAPTAALFAARHPDRTRSLVMHGGYARFLSGDGHEHGPDRATAESYIDNMERQWGTGVGLSLLAPSRADDPAARAFWARLQTTSASPAAAATFLRALATIDIRGVLPSIEVPTLVMHGTRDANVPVESGRLCAELIPGAAWLELDSDVHLIFLSDVIEETTAAVEAFLAPKRRGQVADPALATVLAVGPSDLARRLSAEITAVVRRHGGRALTDPGLAMFDAPRSALRCAEELVSGPHIGQRRLGAAVHTGECLVRDGSAAGIAADLARCLAADADAGEVLISQTVRDLVIEAPFELTTRAARTFAGVPGEWQVFTVEGSTAD